MGKDVLPFCQLITLHAKKPINQSNWYPKSPKTLGERIRKWRMDNCLLQKDVAIKLGVCEDTLTGWENSRYQPSNRNLTAIKYLMNLE
ncbi:MAG: DNA-binding transcriptional regulator YiaG [Bacteroidia bacterium]|jgi:DNA-binding transcriptional regulator YiaG